MAVKKAKLDQAAKDQAAEIRKRNKSMADSAARYAAINEAEEDRLLAERVEHMGYDVLPPDRKKAPSKKKKKG
jgi:hypothetical protein